MRDKDRIPVIFKLWEDIIIGAWNKDNSLPSPDKVLNYWLENSDQRLPQVFYNLGYLGLCKHNGNYYKECAVFTKQELKIDPKYYLFWTSKYDEKMNQLKKPVKRLLKDLDLDHIQAILNDVSEGIYNVPEIYKDTFKSMLMASNNSKYYDRNTI